MKENSIEEDIEKVENLIKRCDECKLKECINCETNWTEVTSIKRIVDSYKKVLKELKDLQEYKRISELTKISCCTAQNCEALNTAIKGELENQKLRQENEELKNNGPIDENEFELAVDCDYDRLKRLIDTADKSEEFILYNNEKWIKEKYSVPTEKIKDKIEELTKEEQELQNSISEEEREEYSDANISYELMNIDIRRSVLKELLEESEEK